MVIMNRDDSSRHVISKMGGIQIKEERISAEEYIDFWKNGVGI